MQAGPDTTPDDTDRITRAVAAFAIGEREFPPLARERARDAILDCAGCMLAGSREALAAPLLATLASFDRPAGALPALLLGAGRFASPADAALYNGTVAHALDYDDTNHPAYAHPSAVLVPVLLALTPLSEASGAQWIDAYIAGFEVFGKLGRALNTQHYRRGWHATGTFGALAAAVAAGRLLRLDATRMARCLGIAASSASGLRANFGSMTKPLHAGLAARAGLTAALLARAGFDACDAVLDHRYGFLQVFNDGLEQDPEPLLAMGEKLEILTEHGLALKPYPACGATHPGIEAAIELRAQLGGEPIRSIRAGVCEMAFAPLIHVLPDGPLQGKFSLHYCVAAALVDGEVGLQSFTPRKIAQADIRALIAKMTMEVDEDLRHDSEFATRLTVVTESGRQLQAFVPLAMGKPARWFSVERMQAKFRDCAEPTLGADGCARAFAALRELDRPSPAAALIAALQPRPALTERETSA